MISENTGAFQLNVIVAMVQGQQQIPQIEVSITECWQLNQIL